MSLQKDKPSIPKQFYETISFYLFFWTQIKCKCKFIYFYRVFGIFSFKTSKFIWCFSLYSNFIKKL